ncbi:MAG: hypothetical protein A2Y89_02625 [Chloroflexi bacterium RBG_13_51_18]|nr:MAG: hypothetical protein A2Y89_02625 [Chloroflexi bacterium RBG_13_51_18]
MESFESWLAGADMDESVKEKTLVIGAGIDSKLQLTFSYLTKPRVVEPYVLSLVLARLPWLNCYQTGGSSNGARVIGWKTFMVHSMVDIEVSDNTFEVRPFYYDVPFFWNRHRIIWIP